MAERIKTLIIDDEPNALEVLRKLIENYCPDLFICGTAHNFETGQKAIDTHKPDLVFLDIEMPIGSGFDLLESLPDRNFHVIFTTAYDQYALKAIKEQALDYILKPIDIDDLTASVEKVKKFMQAPLLAASEIPTHLQGKNKMLAIPTIYGYKIIDHNDVVALKADGSYTSMSMRNGQHIIVSRNLKALESALDPHKFMRVHRSHIINLDEIVEFHKTDGGMVVMSNGERLEVGTTNRSAIQERLDQRLNYL